MKAERVIVQTVSIRSIEIFLQNALVMLTPDLTLQNQTDGGRINSLHLDQIALSGAI